MISEHPYFVALQAHPEFCSRPLNPSPPFLGLVAAACGASVLEAQIAQNEKEYVPPHPESSRVVPEREAATEAGKARAQNAAGIKVVKDLSPRTKTRALENGITVEDDA